MAYSHISSWNDLFLKSPYDSCQLNNCSQFDRLPDEMIIQILVQPILDLDTIGQVIGVSSRMYQLGVYVLNQYRLPSIQLSLMIDQEGKNKMTSQFKVEHLDPIHLSVYFTCTDKRPRRYYSSKASPFIRTMSIIDHYNASTIDSFLDDVSIKSKDFSVRDTNKIINRKIQIKQEGLHILQPKRRWKYSYEISQKTHYEYHLLPIGLAIPLYQFISLDKKQEKKWSMKMMDWIMNKCL